MNGKCSIRSVRNAHKNQEATLAKQNSSHLDQVRLLRRSSSFSQMECPSEANVLVIYTGGTIGMTRNAANCMYFITTRIGIDLLKETCFMCLTCNYIINIIQFAYNILNIILKCWSRNPIC